MTTNDEILRNIKQRKQKKLKFIQNRINAFFVIIFFLAVFIFGLLFFILPKNKTSTLEQRELKKMPELSFGALWNGNYTKGLNLFYSDNLPFREDLVKTKFLIEENRGPNLKDARIYSSAASSGAISSDSFSDKKPDRFSAVVALSLKKSEQNEDAVFLDENDPFFFEENSSLNQEEKDRLKEKFKKFISGETEEKGQTVGPIYVIGDTALEIFYGGESDAHYTEVLNEYKKLFGDTVTVYNLIVPNHFEFGLSESQKKGIGKHEKPYIERIRDKLDTDIVFVDIYETMQKHYNKGEYLYFRTDHHWTGLGAYRAYEKFCEYAGFTPISLDNYEKRTSTGFLGTLYNACRNTKLKENPDTVEYYVTDLPYVQTNTNENLATYKGTLTSEFKSGKTNGYLTFMGGDIPLATIETNNTNGKKIIVFKESYGNAFAPFLVPHYETVYVADIRTFPYNAVDFVKENGIGEVIFLNNIMSAYTPARINNIQSLMVK